MHANFLLGKIITYENGDVYEGDFINQKREGNGSLFNTQLQFVLGKYTYSDGRKYIGEFKNDQFNGKGMGFLTKSNDLFL